MDAWRFGIVTDCYGAALSLEESIAALGEIGFRDVEIPSAQLVDDLLNPPSVAKISQRLASVRNALSNAGITVWQMHGTYGTSDLVGGSEQERRKNVDDYRRLADIAIELGAKAMVIHIGGRDDLCPVKDLERVADTNVKSLSEISGHVAGRGLKLAIENLMSRCMESPKAFNRFGNRIADLKRLVAAVGADKIGICLDTGHANIERIDIPGCIRECGDSLIATHIHENNGVYDMHVFPFSLRSYYCGMDWFKIFAAFRETGYPRPLIGECVNTSGDLPPALVSRYIKSQKALLEAAMRGEFA